MKPPKTAIYAIKAMIYLAERDELRGRAMAPCHQIAEAGDMPERFLLQILRALANAGLLRSSRGIEGGFGLARRPEEVSLLEILEAVEGPADFTPALRPYFAGENRERTMANLEETCHELTDALARRSLADLCADASCSAKPLSHRT
ncbi:MAG TPA: Rrf2 family transcriptional regulator [Pirellulaceae bacterium]|jgi:Rrf2 family protein|nr:Rrf2 family transcriptional regulator [Pirellulaceae bacterium]